jgi:hypothetical protein
MSGGYRHTQIGWVVLGMVTAIATLAASLLPEGGWPVLVVLAFVLPLFSTLTVEVDSEAIRLRFGVGLIRKRVALEQVRGWQAVRNPWYRGWGIRLGRRDVLWNVSGLDAVELILADGRRFRVGTDEPDALRDAIARASGRTPIPDDGTLPGSPPGPRAWLPLVLVVLALLLVLGPVFWLQMRPPTVTVSAEGVQVRSLFYRATLSRDEISAVSLEPTLPRVRLRTNGFSAAGIHRGHFEVEGLGRGRLFVDEGAGPFVFVNLREGFLFVNYDEPERTRALFEEIARVLPDRVRPGSP